MENLKPDHLEVWVRMYEEQTRHARHHESLRSISTNIAVIVTAAALGLFAADVTSDQRWVLALFVTPCSGAGFRPTGYGAVCTS